MTGQLKKISEKTIEENDARRQQSEKKYINQIEILKESLRTKTDEYENIINKLKEELKSIKEKSVEQGDKLQSY